MGKKVNFVKDAVNKTFDNADDLRDFMEEYTEEIKNDMEHLLKMHEFLSDGEGITKAEFDEFTQKQCEELDEFMKNDKATIKELKEFMEMQKQDLEDFVNGGEEDDEEYEIDEDFKEALKQVIREVLAEEKGK